MALSDRIALLKDGGLEQVATPREIYARPATAYTAQFIGQTNLLRGSVHSSIAECGALRFLSTANDGPALFSLRPESISIGADAASISDPVRFRATIRQQIYGGSTELLELVCGSDQLIRARITARGPLSGEHEFAFSASDAIKVSE